MLVIDLEVQELGEPGAEALHSLEEIYSDRLTREYSARYIDVEGTAGSFLLRSLGQRGGDASYARGRIQDYYESGLLD